MLDNLHDEFSNQFIQQEKKILKNLETEFEIFKEDYILVKQKLVKELEQKEILIRELQENQIIQPLVHPEVQLPNLESLNVSEKVIIN